MQNEALRPNAYRNQLLHCTIVIAHVHVLKRRLQTIETSLKMELKDSFLKVVDNTTRSVLLLPEALGR